MNAIWNTNATITVACQCKIGVFVQRSINSLEDVRMAKIVLWHGLVPHKDPRKKRLGSNAKCQVQLFFCQLEQILLIPRNLLPGAADENADQGIAFRSTVRELGRGPGAGQGAASSRRGMT